MNKSFCPIDYGFTWSADWYEFDFKAATQAAKADRDFVAGYLKRQGYKNVKKSSDKQLITKGGIGTGHPQIEELVTVFYVSCPDCDYIELPAQAGNSEG